MALPNLVRAANSTVMITDSSRSGEPRNDRPYFDERALRASVAATQH